MGAYAGNPNWPVLLAEWAPNTNPYYGPSQPFYTDLSPRLIEGWSTEVGLQYELDAEQPGQWSGTWDNRDGALDPSNASSVYAPGVVPFREFRLRAQWPPTIQRLTADQATGGEGTPLAVGTHATAAGMYSDYDTAAQALASASAYQGSQVWRSNIAASATTGNAILGIAGQAVVAPTVAFAARPYALSVQARCTTSGIAPQAKARITWLNSTGGTVSTTLGSAVALNGTVGLITPNPNFDVDTSGWLFFAGGTLSRSTAVVYPGQVASGLLTPDGVSAQCYAESGRGPVVPGNSYTAQAYLNSPVGHTVAMSLNWYDANLNYLSTSPGTATSIGTSTWTLVQTSANAPAGAAFGTAIVIEGSTPPSGALVYVSQAGLIDPTKTSVAWTQATVAGTVPAGAVSASIALTLSFGPASACTVQTDGWQWEQAPAATSFTVPGTWYPIVAGLVERYPQALDLDGIFPVVRPIVVDSYALLSQINMRDPLTSAVNTPTGGQPPTFAFDLGDPSGSTTFTDATGNRPAAQIVACKAGAGTITPGTSQTSVSAGGGFLGSSSTVTNITSATSAGSTIVAPMSVISLPPLPTSGAYGPGGGTGLGFTRMIAFRCTQLPSTGGAAVLWSAVGGKNGANNLSAQLSTDGHYIVQLIDATHSDAYTITTFDVGNWHLAWLGVAADGGSLLAGLDGSPGSFLPSPSSDYAFTGGFQADYIGATFGWNLPLDMVWNFRGDVAFMVEWPFLLSSSQITAIYNSWKTAFSGDTSGGRYARILGWAGNGAPTAIDTGQTTTMGPATDIIGLDALSCLQAVVDTETGQHHIAADGTITFLARSHRYNANTPQYVFGPNTAGGELPIELGGGDLFDFDPTYISNLAQITQESTNQVYSAQDTTSQGQYGTRTLQRTNQSTNALEVQACAAYLVSRYKDPHLRVAEIVIHPAAVPVTLWPVALSILLSSRQRAKIQPPTGAPEITADGFVEKLQWQVGAQDDTDATLTLQMSPVDPTPYGLFTSLHASLHTAVTGPTNTITLNALADAATNPARGSLTGGQQLVLDPGLATQETVTIATGGVPATGTGYSTVTITLTANTAQLHAATAVICEPLPSGTSSPTAFDPNAVFDSVFFAY